MTIRLNGQTSGYVELEAPNAAGSNTLVLPTGNGTSGQYLQTNGSGTLSWQTVTDNNTFGYTSLGETTTTSGNSHSVTGIPSTATQVLVIVNSVSFNNTNTPQLQMVLGNGAYDTGSNYLWSVVYGSGSNQASTSGTNVRLIHTNYGSAANTFTGIIRIVSGTTHVCGESNLIYHGGTLNFGAFKWTGSNTIDRVQLVAASGAAFDAGSFEVLHNG